MDFQKFLKENKKEIYKMADNNTCKNANGVIVVAKEDEWEQDIKH